MKNNNTLKKNILSKTYPSEEEAKEAVKTLIAWAGDNPCLLYTSPSPRDRG